MRIAVLLCVAVMACAQTPAYEIRGVVVDKVSNQPITAAKVTLLKLGGNVNPPAVTTNALGEFHFLPEAAGSYNLNAEADGYLENYSGTALTPQKPVQIVRIALAKGGVVSGRLVDADTNEPIADYPVQVLSHEYSKGVYTARRFARVQTDAQGRFQAIGLPDEEWLVAIWPPFFESEEPNLTEFTAADAEAPDELYPVVYWPGGGSFETALPMKSAGVPVDVGTIRLRKVAYRRALVRSPEGCKPGDKYEGWLHAMGVDRTYRSTVNIACGRDVLLRGLIPGERYRLGVQPQSGNASTGRRSAEILFTATDRNLELKPVLRPAVDLEGQVKLADRSSPWPAGLSVNGTVPDAQGRFRFAEVPVGEFRLRITELGNRHVIQEIRLAGQPLLAQEVQSFEWTGVGPLEITLDDKPASLIVVTKAAKAAIVLFRWPLPAGADIYGARIEMASGAAQRLAAGEYRVLAVPEAMRQKLEAPGVLERLLSRAKQVTLERGASITLELEAIDPDR